MAGERIDITLPTGEAATVPREDLDQALAAGAHVQSDGERAKEELGPVFGPVAAGVLGAGRTMTFGTSDHALTETAGYLGGDKAREHMLYALNATKEAFPDATTAGEVGGLFIPSGAGSAIMKAGEIAEKGATTLLGKGLVGTVAGYGLRGGVEAGIMGVGKQISEDALADREHDGETLIAAGKKDFLVGAPIGAAFGLLAAGASRAAGNASGLLAGKGRGPLPNRVLDEVAGVEGAGARLASDAKAAQTTIEDLRKAGLTSEQAAKVVDGAQSFAEARAAAGPFSGLVDSVADIVLKNRTAANPELGAVAKRSYQEASKRVAGYESTLDGYALKLKKLTDRVFRGEDVLDEVQFTYKAEQMARHVEPGLLDAQRDTVAKLLQDTDDMLRFWESTEAKGGVGGSIKTLRANHTDLLYKLAKVDESGAATTSRDLFIGVDKFKRTLDQYARHGEKNGLPEAILHADNGIRPMADRWRATLEDAGVWGKAGDVQREWNASFAIGKTRRDDFRSRFAVRLDQDRGQWVPEADAEKFKNNLLRKIGSEADSQQTLKSTDTWRETVSTRDAKVREYGELTPRQIEALDDARAARIELNQVLYEAKQETEIVNRLRAQQLEERDRALGGILGLASDIVTKPITTMERLGAVRHVAEKFDKHLFSSLRNVFEGAAPKAAAAGEAATKVRPRADVVKEIESVRELSANPMAVEERVRKMVGDLSKHAPKTAQSAAITALRLVTYLATQTPKPRTSFGPFDPEGKTRYSDHDLVVYARKSAAGHNPGSVLEQLDRGVLDRDGIATLKAVYPFTFERLQAQAWEELGRLAQAGKLDSVPRQRKAAISILLGVPADQTWTPEFVSKMQAAKAQPTQPAQTVAPQPQGGGRRPIKLNTTLLQTEAQQVEARAQ